MLEDLPIRTRERMIGQQNGKIACRMVVARLQRAAFK